MNLKKGKSRGFVLFYGIRYLVVHIENCRKFFPISPIYKSPTSQIHCKPSKTEAKSPYNNNDKNSRRIEVLGGKKQGYVLGFFGSRQKQNSSSNHQQKATVHNLDRLNNQENSPVKEKPCSTSKTVAKSLHIRTIVEE